MFSCEEGGGASTFLWNRIYEYRYFYSDSVKRQKSTYLLIMLLISSSGYFWTVIRIRYRSARVRIHGSAPLNYEYGLEICSLLQWLSRLKRKFSSYFEILVRIWIRGSMPLTYGSGSCYFRQWPTRSSSKKISRNQCFSYYFCLMIDGYGRPKNTWILRIRIWIRIRILIRKTAFVPIFSLLPGVCCGASGQQVQDSRSRPARPGGRYRV